MQKYWPDNGQAFDTAVLVFPAQTKLLSNRTAMSISMWLRIQDSPTVQYLLEIECLANRPKHVCFNSFSKE